MSSCLVHLGKLLNLGNFRPDFYNEKTNSHDVDLVITTVEVEQMLSEDNLNLSELDTMSLDTLGCENSSNTR